MSHHTFHHVAGKIQSYKLELKWFLFWWLRLVSERQLTRHESPTLEQAVVRCASHVRTLFLFFLRPWHTTMSVASRAGARCRAHSSAEMPSVESCTSSMSPVITFKLGLSTRMFHLDPDEFWSWSLTHPAIDQMRHCILQCCCRW